MDKNENPSNLTLQETKFQVSGMHKIDGYFVYEHLRYEKTAGGGILMAIMQELNPSLVSDGGDDAEALTVDINVKKMQIACSTAYGPQEKYPQIKQERCWQYLDKEAKRADEEGKGYILQGDLNAWLGKKYIHSDPRHQNKNVKFFAEFLESNELTVVNGLGLCTGLFTRIRKSKNNEEKSIIDFFLCANEYLLMYKA